MMRLAFLTLLSILLSGPAIGQSVQPTKIRVRGVELHYIEQGQGEPLILLHGGQGDYRSWDPQIEAFSKQYRVISYSRRYNYPNNNPLTAKNHSAYTEADDLAAFIHKVGLGRVHLVGTSMGAFTALVLAVKHPEMVRSLVLAEPPVHRWMRDSPNGAAAYREFMTNTWEPSERSFKAGDDKGAMRIFGNGLSATPGFDRLPSEGVAAIMRNSGAMKALTVSSDPFPDLSKDKVRRLRVPILIITGENTIKLHKLVNEELARLLPKAELATIPNAGHGSARENPQAFNEAVLKFLDDWAVRSLGIQSHPVEQRAASGVAKISERWSKEWSAKNLDALIPLYAEDAVFLTATGSRTTGRAAIRDLFEKALAVNTSELHVLSKVTEQSGNLAYHSGEYEETSTSGGVKRSGKGNYLVVFRRDGKNQWRIVQHMWTDVPATGQ
jgi:uncharacterized protein (TIGR02246 family)